MKKNKIKIIYGVVTILTLVFLFLPLPYFIEAPGTTEDLRDFVTIEGKKDSAKGSFSLTSVSFMPATPIRILIAQFDDFQDVLSKKELMGTQSSSEYESIQRFYMQTSQNMAKLNALSQANLDYDFNFLGVYVMAIEKNSSFKDVLQVADTVTKVNNKSFDNSEDLVNYVQSQKVGSSVEITFEQNNEEKTAKGKIIKLSSGNSGIGITLINHTEITSNPSIEINAGSIGGPSAGLMFTLEIYQQLSGKDLRQGLDIAGTGTIDSEGIIGRIGGIDKKIATAVKNNADVFFAPDDKITDEMKKADPDIKTNYQEALAAKKKLGADIKIVPVKTLQDAIEYLEQMR